MFSFAVHLKIDSDDVYMWNLTDMLLPWESAIDCIYPNFLAQSKHNYKGNYEGWI